MSTITESLCHRVVEAVPELRPALDEHLDDNDGVLLPHVFFGDVTRWAQRTAGGDDPEPAARLIEVLDQEWDGGDEEVRELIAVSFLENLDDDSPVVAMLPPALAAEYAEQDW